MAGMRAVLKKWGAICEHVRLWNAYPSSDTTYRARLGGGPSNRLPIPEIPSFAVQMSEQVMKLPDDEGNAVTIWYCHTFNPAGQWWSPGDKALVLGMCERTLRDQERAGRERLLFTAKHVLDTLHDYQEFDRNQIA